METTAALVKEDTAQETEGAEEMVHTSAELVRVRSLLSARAPVKGAEEPVTNSTVTAPTAGVLTKAATVSMFVLIFSPAVAVAGTASFAARVKPVHVTVTAPAASVDVVPRVIVIVSVVAGGPAAAAAYRAVPAAVVGEEMAQAVPPPTRPSGKDKMTLLAVG